MTKAIIVVSDLHIGSNAGLCPPEGYALPDGNRYQQNIYQKTTWRYWVHFWKEIVPKRIHNCRKVVVVVNGDAIDGVHHNTTSIMSTSWETQERAAVEVLKKINKYDGMFIVRGTEAHVDVGAQSEERIGRQVGAAKNEIGEYSSYQVWLDVEGLLFQFAHHIAVTSSAAYESSAPMREMIAGLTDAMQWDRKLPDVFVRSHRHRFIEVPLPTTRGRIRSVITPGWQLKTPHVERIDRMRMPHIGGVVFVVENGLCEVKEQLYRLPQPEAVKI
jgi:hypothetical protein